MNVAKLVAMGRLLPIKKQDAESPTGWSLVGYTRKASSRKFKGEMLLKTPRPCAPPPGEKEGWTLAEGLYGHHPNYKQAADAIKFRESGQVSTDFNITYRGVELWVRKDDTVGALLKRMGEIDVADYRQKDTSMPLPEENNAEVKNQLRVGVMGMGPAPSSLLTHQLGAMPSPQVIVVDSITQPPEAFPAPLVSLPKYEKPANDAPG